jgi:lipid A 3-O-deacylase
MQIMCISPSINIVGIFLLLFQVYSAAQEHRGAREETWDISIWAAGATGEENRNSLSEAQLWTAGVFIGKVIATDFGSGYLNGNLEYGFELVPITVSSGAQNLYAGGFNPVVLRWNSYRRSSHVLPYIELAGGAVISNANLPPGDTSSFNFAVKGGGGIEVLRKERQSLDFGCKWLHISNANLGVRNPEFNGLQISLGYHWFR